MACINPDGTVSAVARKVLAAIVSTGAVGDIAASADLPVYLVRASLRELTQAGFVMQRDDRYDLTEEGHRALHG